MDSRGTPLYRRYHHKGLRAKNRAGLPVRKFQRTLELLWQVDILEQWIGSPSTPVDELPRLREILAQVKVQIHDRKVSAGVPFAEPGSLGLQSEQCLSPSELTKSGTGLPPVRKAK